MFNVSVHQQNGVEPHDLCFWHLLSDSNQPCYWAVFAKPKCLVQHGLLPPLTQLVFCQKSRSLMALLFLYCKVKIKNPSPPTAALCFQPFHLNSGPLLPLAGLDWPFFFCSVSQDILFCFCCPLWRQLDRLYIYCFTVEFTVYSSNLVWHIDIACMPMFVSV